MSSIPIALIDDSPICRLRLKEVVEAEGDIQVVGELASGRDVLGLLERKRPRVLLTDLVMPGVDGLEVVRDVMRSQPLPIIIVSAGGFTEVSAFEALRHGALEVAKKPSQGEAREERALRAAIRRLASAFVVRHPGRVAELAVTPPPAALGPLGPQRVRVLGVGASAGGPPAVASLLGALPRERAPAVLVAQHMPPDHVQDFAGFLSRRCRLDISIVRGTTAVVPGRVLIPGDGMNLVMTAPDRVSAAPSEQALTPSVDALFSSMARELGPAAAAIVLSGIGNDGALGLGQLRGKGALTMAQDERSSAVYGMPKAAAPFAAQKLSPEQAAAWVLGHVPLGPRLGRTP